MSLSGILQQVPRFITKAGVSPGVIFPCVHSNVSCSSAPPLWCRSSLEWLIIEITLRKLILCLFRLFYLYFCLHFEFYYSNRFSLSLGIVQACLFLHEFFLYDFALTQLENLHDFLNLCNTFWFNTIWHRWYTIIIVLTRFGTHDLWAFLSCVVGQQKVISLSCHQSCVWIDYVGDIITQLI